MTHWVLDDIQPGEKPSPARTGTITDLTEDELEITLDSGGTVRMKGGSPEGYEKGGRYVFRQKQ